MKRDIIKVKGIPNDPSLCFVGIMGDYAEQQPQYREMQIMMAAAEVSMMMSMSTKELSNSTIGIVKDAFIFMEKEAKDDYDKELLKRNKEWWKSVQAHNEWIKAGMPEREIHDVNNGI